MARNLCALIIAGLFMSGCNQDAPSMHLNRYLKKQFDMKLGTDIKYCLVIGSGCPNCIAGLIEDIRMNVIRDEAIVIIAIPGYYKGHELNKLENRENVFWDKRRNIFRAGIRINTASLIYLRNSSIDSIETVGATNCKEVSKKILIIDGARGQG